MISLFNYLLILCSLLLYISASTAKTPFRPKALLLPVTKDSSTLQYLTHINQRTPSVPVKLTLDIGGRSLWVDCEQDYISYSYKPGRCGSSLCKLVNPNGCGSTCLSTPKPGCNNSTCYLPFDNSVKEIGTIGEVGTDILYIQSTNGQNPGKLVSIPKFPFACGSTLILDRLASGVKGMAGFGITNFSFPTQLSATFGFKNKFAICLSSSLEHNGVIFIGDGPYEFLPDNFDISQRLIYTPLIINPVNIGAAIDPGKPSTEYFIGVRSIKVNGKRVKISNKLLTISKKGDGGTKITTVNPYTVMEASIYEAVTEDFVKAMNESEVPRVEAVEPFEFCFSANHIGVGRVGPIVPAIDLVLQDKDTVWRILGANSMVSVNENTLCLGFVTEWSRSSIVIGGHQLENNLLQFDLTSKTLGFGNSLLHSPTACSNFNFTSV